MHNPETKAVLTEFIENNVYGSDGYDFYDLFKLFSALEVRSVEDLLDAPQKYEAFLQKNIHLIKQADDTMPHRLSALAKIARENIEKDFQKLNVDEQEKFSMIVKEMLQNDPSLKILDVGAGKYPLSSAFIAKHFDNVSTMDEDFAIANQAIKAMNVNPVKGHFSERTPIDNYDVVVGRYPCSAIVPIIKQCASQNKPYIISLCLCHLPTKMELLGTDYGWAEVLPDLDKNAKIYGNFAFNFNIPMEKVKEIIDKYQPVQQPTTRKTHVSFSEVKYTGKWHLFDDTPNIIERGDYD